MTVSEKWVYLNNRGNHYYYKKDYQEALVYMQASSGADSGLPANGIQKQPFEVNWAIFIC